MGLSPITIYDAQTDILILRLSSLRVQDFISVLTGWPYLSPFPLGAHQTRSRVGAFHPSRAFPPSYFY
jgi:hypothetical protein